jgi:hypothetical protein
MNTINLNAASVVELDSMEARELNGGGVVKTILVLAADAAENWEECKKSFMEGLKAGNSIY